MEIKTISSTFPNSINTVIKEVLKHTSEGIVIRDKLINIYNDLWIVIEGKQFSYSVSRASKSAGIYSNLTKGIKYLIYTPPFTEIPSNIRERPQNASNWTVTLLKKSPKTLDFVTDEIFYCMESADYTDTNKACEFIKAKANSVLENFWHVFVGTSFVCVLPKADIEHLIYATAKRGGDTLNVVVFRRQGLQKKIDFSGLLTGVLYLVMTFVFFLGVFGILKCESGSQSFICKNHQTFLGLGLAFIFSRSIKSLINKIKYKS
jgi:hypothetical protein